MKTNPLTETKTTPTNTPLFSAHPNKDAAMQARLQQQRKNRESGLTNFNLICNCVGVIRSKWYNKRHELMTFSYGTAFQVSPRILITCTHNLFSKFRSTWAHEVEFVPGVKQGEIQEYYEKVRKSVGCQGKVEMETYKVKYVYSLFDLENDPTLKDHVSFENNPQNYEVSLVVLQERANQQKEGLEERSEERQQLRMGDMQKEGNKSREGVCLKEVDKCKNKGKYISLRKYSLNESLPLTIIGYPSHKFRTCMRFDKAYVKRSELYGLPYLSKTQEKDNIVHYRIPTSVGMSGSPILVCDDKTYSAIGIHTHRGQEPGYNSGIYFDAEMIRRIKELEANIERNEKIPRSIDCVQRDKQIQQQNEKHENDEDTPSPKGEPQQANNSRVNSPMDELALPQLNELSDQQYENKSEMSNQIDEPSEPSEPSQPSPLQTPSKSANQPERSLQQSSDWSNTSEMSQLDNIYEFLTLIKEPLCDSQPTSAIALTHSCDLSQFSIAGLSPYSNQQPQQGRAGSRIAHF